MMKGPRRSNYALPLRTPHHSLPVAKQVHKRTECYHKSPWAVHAWGVDVDRESVRRCARVCASRRTNYLGWESYSHLTNAGGRALLTASFGNEPTLPRNGSRTLPRPRACRHPIRPKCASIAIISCQGCGRRDKLVLHRCSMSFHRTL